MGVPRLIDGAPTRASRLLAMAAALLAASSIASIGCAEPASIGVAREAQRPDTPASREPPPVFAADDVVESFASAGGGFRVHFARSGPSVPPAADADGSGVPDFVEMVARTYDAVGAFYHDELGYRLPPSDEDVPDGNGGDARFDVYLVDFALRADGAYRRELCDADHPSICTGYMAQENDFAGYGYPSLETAVRILASHEYFHAVQAGYDADQGTVIAEGTAVWATETFDPSLRDFEGFVPAYLERPDLPLDRVASGPFDPFSYGAALFFEHLSESLDRDVIRQLYEDCEDGARGVDDPQWLPALDALLVRDRATSFADVFSRFVTWNLYTGDYADPAVAYERGRAYPVVAMRETAAPFEDAMVRIAHASARYYLVTPAGRDVMTAALVAPESELAGLRLLIARRGFESIDEAWIGPPAEAPAMELGSSVDLVVAVVDVRVDGDSSRPGLCIGAPDEVSACRASLGAMMPTEDAGVPDEDAGPSDEDAGAITPPTPPPPADAGADAATMTPRHDDDGGCNASGRAPLASLGPIALALIALLLSASRTSRGCSAGRRSRR